MWKSQSSGKVAAFLLVKILLGFKQKNKYWIASSDAKVTTITHSMPPPHIISRLPGSPAWWKAPGKELKVVHILVNALAYIFSASDVTPKQALHSAL